MLLLTVSVYLHHWHLILLANDPQCVSAYCMCVSITSISCLPLIVPCLFLLTIPMFVCHAGLTMGLDGGLWQLLDGAYINRCCQLTAGDGKLVL